MKELIEVKDVKTFDEIPSGTRFVYTILQTEMTKKGEYIPCIVFDGYRGYFRTDYHWGTDLDHAEACAEAKNKRMGINKKDAIRIVLLSMRPKQIGF